MMPPAPGRLSTRTVWPRVLEIWSARMRNSRSMLPPGGTEMTMRMVRPACDHAGSLAATKLSKAAAAKTTASSFRMGISSDDGAPVSAPQSP
jgi:hypothetical protein